LLGLALDLIEQELAFPMHDKVRHASPEQLEGLMEVSCESFFLELCIH
jgi:hypothetical protein